MVVLSVAGLGVTVVQTKPLRHEFIRSGQEALIGNGQRLKWCAI